MEKTNPLDALKDIHLPQETGLWPLAPGWYLLILLILLISSFITWFLLRRYKLNQPKREALILLHHIKNDFAKTGNSQQASARIAELLKRVALVYYPRAKVASLHGQEWISFLNQTGSIHFDPEAFMLLELPFQTSQSCDISPLIIKTEQWIKQRRIHA